MPKQFDPCDRCPEYYKANCKMHDRICLIRVLIYECWVSGRRKNNDQR